MSLNIDVNNVLSNLNNYSPDQKKELLNLLEEYEKSKTNSACKENFLSFVKEMWPAFINGNHHKIMADAFKDCC